MRLRLRLDEEERRSRRRKRRLVRTGELGYDARTRVQMVKGEVSLLKRGEVSASRAGQKGVCGSPRISTCKRARDPSLSDVLKQGREEAVVQWGPMGGEVASSSEEG